MSGSHAYEIRLSDGFERSLDELFRVNYKKDKKGVGEATEAVGAAIEALRLSPCGDPRDLEPWPRTMSVPPQSDGLELRKVRIAMPRLDGDARQGRLMYLVNRPERTVEVFAVYTHKQFKGRPADKDLERILKGIMEHRTGNTGKLAVVADADADAVANKRDG